MSRTLQRRKQRITSFRIIASGFFVLILIGTLLLMLPAARQTDAPVRFLDCLFTATSAVCVTGLVVQDTASFWSPFGQAVLLLLIQIGGMGVVTTAVSISHLSGRRIGLMQRSVMQESISAPQLGGIVRLTRFLVLTALGMEGIGALLLLPEMTRSFGWGSGVWFAVFHAVSAFCNAGFDLMGVRAPYSSLTGYAMNPWVNFVIMLLITLGGIGFLVWQDVREYGLRWKTYRLQSRVAILTSGLLHALGALWLYFFELQELPPQSRILPSLFQSVTLRTAGFNTVDLNRISGSGQSLMILLMLVGGSPGSTAGGMKTTTLAVVLVTAWRVIRREDDVHLLGRRVAEETVRHAFAILVLYGLLFYASGLAMARVERLPLMACLFEAASALGTVGLTLGITGQLGAASRLILILLMFLGRVGGLTLAYAAQSGWNVGRSTRPMEKLNVG